MARKKAKRKTVRRKKTVTRAAAPKRRRRRIGKPKTGIMDTMQTVGISAAGALGATIVSGLIAKGFKTSPVISSAATAGLGLALTAISKNPMVKGIGLGVAIGGTVSAARPMLVKAGLGNLRISGLSDMQQLGGLSDMQQLGGLSDMQQIGMQEEIEEIEEIEEDENVKSSSNVLRG